MTPLFAAYERLYVINLASRADRRAEMAEQLQRVGLSFASPQVRLFEAVRPADAGPFPSVGAHGCFMSHLGVLRDARSAGLQRIVIFEDDLNFAADFATLALPALAAAERPECAIFYGGHELAQPLAAGAGAVEIAADRPIQTAHFVAFHGAAIGTAVDYLEAMLRRAPGDPAGGPMHVDGAYSWLRRAHPALRTWAALPVLGHQRSSRTDIHALRWFDRLPLVRDAVARLRRVRNR